MVSLRMRFVRLLVLLLVLLEVAHSHGRALCSSLFLNLFFLLLDLACSELWQVVRFRFRGAERGTSLLLVLSWWHGGAGAQINEIAAKQGQLSSKCTVKLIMSKIFSLQILAG